MRVILAFAAVATALSLSACTAPSEDSQPGELPEIRRIVTSEGDDGQSFVLADGRSPNVVELNGSRIVRLWETSELPVSIPVDDDSGAAAGNAYREGFVGSSLYIADLPPGSDLEDIPIHSQDSLDYIALLDGEIDLVLDTGERIRMARGDVLVQAGNAHSWVNPGETQARLLVVVLTGQRDKPQVHGSEDAIDE